MRSRKVWNDTINGFPVEFVNWSSGSESGFDNWNYYIYFSCENTPAEFWGRLLTMQPGKYSIDYYASFLAGLEWHHGITFARFERNGMQEIVAVKAGCDYAHYWDEGIKYTLDDLISDATATIESARVLFQTC